MFTLDIIIWLGIIGMLSSAGRASPLHGGGREFEPLSIHHFQEMGK